jgi:outer membrane protein assembly factor BamB
LARRFSFCSVILLLAVFVGGCDWSQYMFSPAHTGFNAFETKITPANVGTLVPRFTVALGAGFSEGQTSVVGGDAYTVANDGQLYAFSADGSGGCEGTPLVCAPRWQATVGVVSASMPVGPSVVGGTVYVYGSDGNLYAFDAAGNTNCSGDPKTCTPLWTAATGGLLLSLSSPAIANGVAYIGSTDGRLYAFDATGDTNCSGIPKTCAPLWTAVTADEIVHSSPAVANGVVYIGSQDHSVYAFDATGDVNCSGAPKVCTPLWSATTGAGISASPVVAYGRVFVGSLDNDVYAFSITPPSG